MKCNLVMKCNKTERWNSSNVKTEKENLPKAKNGIKGNLKQKIYPRIFFFTNSLIFVTIICEFITMKK